MAIVKSKKKHLKISTVKKKRQLEKKLQNKFQNQN